MRVIGIAVLVGLSIVPGSSQEIGPSPYEVVEGWLTPFAGEGFALGGNSGVFAETPDRIFVLQRGETRLPEEVPPEFSGFVGSIGINALRDGERRTWQNCIFVVDGDGNVVEVWEQWDYLFEGSDGPGPHRIRISPYDPERRVWVVHETAHQIYVFSNDGSELLMTLGERDVAGDDETHFGKPQDIAFLPDGRVLVADGYDNTRVIVLDREGKYLSEFGEPGDGPGQFKVVHSLALGPGGRLFVADRDNRRIQVFRESGNNEFTFVDQWTGFGLTLDLIVSGNNVWVSYLTPPKVTKLDLDGNWLYTWQLPTEGPNRFLEMHSFAVDSDGNLYGSDNQNGRTQKFVPKTSADRQLLIGTPWIDRLRTDWASLRRYRDDNARLGPPKTGEARVVFCGDSITDAWAEHFETMFPGKPYVGRGISGQTTPQMLVRFRQDVVALAPKVVVILAGTNDIAGNTGPSTLEMIEDNLASMAELAKANDIRVVLASVLPAYDYVWRPGLEPAPKIVALNAWMQDYAARNGVVYLDYHGAMADERQGLPLELSRDGVHPNEAGYRVMAPLAEKAIGEALTQR